MARYSDRPTKSGGNGTLMGLIFFAVIGGGIIGALSWRVFIAQKIGAAYILVVPGLPFTLLDLVMFVIGASIGLATALKAWKAVREDIAEESAD